MQQNTGPLDRTIRIFGGLTLALLGILRLMKNRRGLIMSLLGLGLLAEGLLGYCLGYDLLGISTRDQIDSRPEPWR